METRQGHALLHILSTLTYAGTRSLQCNLCPFFLFFIVFVPLLLLF